MESVVTPINVVNFRKLLEDTNYDSIKTNFLVEGFTEGFRLGYEGPRNRCLEGRNLPFRVGTPVDLWNKIMKEVQLGRIVGPMDKVNFQYYHCSPLGLVPKPHSNDLRLIFHLSWPNGDSVNHYTPEEYTKVRYNDLDKAIKLCLAAGKGCYCAKVDCR